MLLRDQMAKIVNEMLDGRILLPEAMSEFENLYIELALKRNMNHISKTAEILGIHRNTLARRASAVKSRQRPTKRLNARGNR